MSRAATAQELTYFRTAGQRSELYVAFRSPGTIYTAQVNGTPTGDNANFPNDMVGEVGFDNGTGTLGDIKVGMTAWVGSTAGARDLGMCYVRKTPIAGTFYFGETSEIDWADDVHITIVDDFQIWAKHVKIASGATVMDFDVAYSDQHENFDPIVNMGGDMVVWLEGATVDTEWDASGSSVFGSSVSAYSWSAPGASGATGTGTATPTITYNAAGQYVVYCTITGANGASHTGKRIVWVFSSASMPETDFELSNCSIDFQEGGCRFEITMSQDADITEVYERTKVVLFAKDWYGDTEISIGPETGRENIIAEGWIARESIEFDPEQGSVRFMVYGAQEWLKRIPAFPVGIEFDNAPTVWTDMAGLNVDRAIWHLLHWRTTFSGLADINVSGDTRYSLELSGQSSSLWEQMREIAWTSIFAVCGVDWFGAFYLAVEPLLVPEADRTGWPTIQTLTKDDWGDVIEIERQIVTPTSMVSLSGVRVDSTGNGYAIFSLAPGHVFKRYGVPEILDRLLLTSQSQANSQAGLYLAYKNNEYPRLIVEMACNHRLTTLWPAQYFAISISASDTQRGITYSGNLIPRQVDYQWDAGAGVLTSHIYFEAETSEDLNIDGDIPVGDGTFISFPPLPKLPKLPPLPPLEPFVPFEIAIDDFLLDAGPRYIVVQMTDYGIAYTINGDVSSPNWLAMNDGIDDTDEISVKNLVIAPSGRLFVMCRGAAGIGDTVYYADGLGAPWVLLHEEDDNIVGIGVNPDVDEQIGMLAGNNGNMSFYLGDSTGLSETATGIDADPYFAGVVCNLGKWIVQHAEDNLFASQALSRFSAVGATEINTYNPANGQTYSASWHHARAGGNYVYAWNNDSRYLRRIIDGDLANSTTVLTNVGSISTPLPEFLDCDPTGQYLMAGRNGALGFKSEDFGATWVNVDASLGTTYYMWANCLTPNAWLAAGGDVIKYSPDFGVTWATKTGDLGTVFPSPSLSHVHCYGWGDGS